MHYVEIALVDHFFIIGVFIYALQIFDFVFIGIAHRRNAYIQLRKYFEMHFADYADTDHRRFHLFFHFTVRSIVLRAESGSRRRCCRYYLFGDFFKPGRAFHTLKDLSFIV